jgi:hypothetical protein
MGTLMKNADLSNKLEKKDRKESFSDDDEISDVNLKEKLRTLFLDDKKYGNLERIEQEEKDYSKLVSKNGGKENILKLMNITRIMKE